MDIISKLRKDREDTIMNLRRGEFGYANVTIRQIVDYMPQEFRMQVVGHFNACNYVKVADLLEHLWTHVELPSIEQESGL